MSNTFWIAVGPMILGTVLYVLQTIGFAAILQRPGMALAFFGYALANVGIIWDAHQMGMLK